MKNSPTRVPNLIRWRNALLCSGKQDHKVSNSTKAALLTMAVRAHNDTLSFFMPISELAEWMGVPRRTAERYVADALTSGWLVQTRQGNSRGMASEYRLTFGPTNNPTGVIPRPSAKVSSTVDADEGPDKSDGGSRQKWRVGPDKSGGPTTPTTTPSTTKSKNTRSAELSAAPLPPAWTPNKFHHAKAQDLGIDIEDAAQRFIHAMRYEKRTDWGRTFGAYLDAIAAGREQDVFPTCIEELP